LVLSLVPIKATLIHKHKRQMIMKNLISIVEIPTIEFPRAVTFYQTILNISIEEINMDGVLMGLFPGDGETISVALINSNQYKTSMDGAVVYFNAGDDLQIVLDKIKANGGKIIVPKTDIGSGMGFYAMFKDTEGNKLGLHSKN
jgi:predicted enzyme related to lactoylglutathione lyase